MTITTKFLTEDQFNNLCESIAVSLPYETAARLANISTTTLYRYRRDAEALRLNDPTISEFSPEYVEFLQEFIERLTLSLALDEKDLVNDLRMQSKKGNHKSTTYLLEKRHAHWGAENNPVGNKNQQRNFDEMTEAQLIEIQEGTIVEDDPE